VSFHLKFAQHCVDTTMSLWHHCDMWKSFKCKNTCILFIRGYTKSCILWILDLHSAGLWFSNFLSLRTHFIATKTAADTFVLSTFFRSLRNYIRFMDPQGPKEFMDTRLRIPIPAQSV